MWCWLTDRVMRHPVVAIVIAGGALVALTIPALGMQTKCPASSHGQDAARRPDVLKVQKAFPAEADYAMVVVKADTSPATVKKAIDRLNPSEVLVDPAATSRW